MLLAAQQHREHNTAQLYYPPWTALSAPAEHALAFTLNLTDSAQELIHQMLQLSLQKLFSLLSPAKRRNFCAYAVDIVPATFRGTTEFQTLQVIQSRYTFQSCSVIKHRA